MTVAEVNALEAFLVPAARALPSNRAYLAHLAASVNDPDLIRLASNENTEPPSPRVCEALERAFLDANLSPPPNPPLQHAIAERYDVEPSQVLVTAGSTEVIDAAFRTFLRAGSEVILPDPSWPVFRRRLEALEAHIVDVSLTVDEHGFHYDTARVLDAISNETRLVVICTPNNPTGNAMELAEIRRIAETGIPFLIDAAYADFDATRDPMHLVHEFDNIIITRTFSKAYCLAGVRVGYAVGNAGLLDFIDRFLVPGSSVSSPALHAGLAAFEDEAYHQHQVERIASERERLFPLLRDLGLRTYPSRGNFLAVDCSQPAIAASFAASVLAQLVVIRPLGSLVRISIGRQEENDALVAAVERVIEAEGAP